MTQTLDELPKTFKCKAKNSVGTTEQKITIKEATIPETPKAPINGTVGIMVQLLIKTQLVLVYKSQ